MDYSVRTTYRSLAPIYDELTDANDYEMWLGEVLLPELEKHGLRKGRALDVGCGTGRAFKPLLTRGWEVQGCDISAEMLEAARLKFGDAVRLDQADLLDFPVFGEFDLVIALNDVVNYLVGDDDLATAFAAMEANLAPGGLALFDANTLGLFRDMFASGEDDPKSVGDWQWLGQEGGVQAGGVFDSRLRGRGIAADVLHRERHHPAEEVRGAIASAGLELLAALGQREADGRVLLDDPPDEWRHHKVIYVARKAP